MTDLLDMIREDRSKLDARREQNRREFPTAAMLMDAFSTFSPRIIYAEENGKTIQRRGE